MTESPQSEMPRQNPLAEGLRRGDDEAFAALYREYADGIHHVAERMTGNPADAADVLQETFLAVFRRIETWRGEGSLRAWLYQIAVRIALKHRRKRPITLDFEAEGSTPPTIVDAPPAEQDFRAACDREIQRLPNGARTIFTMFVVEGLTHPEIAQALGIDEGTSKSQLHYARSLLKRRLARFERELS